MQWDHFVKPAQFAAAMLAIPAAAGGTFSVYKSYFSAEVACQSLRSTIVSGLDKNLSPEAKRALLQKDVSEFSVKCAGIDPDANAVFRAALVAPEKSQAQGASAGAPAGSRQTALLPGSFNKPDEKGWVVMERRDAGHAGEFNFEEYKASVPLPAGTKLTARLIMPVWLEPQVGSRDPARVQARLAPGACVQVVGTRTVGAGRLWAEVKPADCTVGKKP